VVQQCGVLCGGAGRVALPLGQLGQHAHALLPALYCSMQAAASNSMQLEGQLCRRCGQQCTGTTIRWADERCHTMLGGCKLRVSCSVV
jgi:hypothetical protein